MYRKVEREIRYLARDQFEEIIKFIPSVQQDAFYLLYYLGIRFKDIVKLRGVNISEDGIWINKKKYIWPENPNQELLFVRTRLLETAQQFPDARLFEAQKPIIKAVTDLPRAFKKGFERYSHFQEKPTDKIEGRLPGFLVLGTPKSATTWLYHSLKAHPEIYLPDKELEFFGSYRFHYGINW
ncbi:MAG: hypothetical protein MUO62_17910, partial [Anaerolineales bacterium]|nr:hypothetical protein [Anaerolineales bacterium]